MHLEVIDKQVIIKNDGLPYIVIGIDNVGDKDSANIRRLINCNILRAYTDVPLAISVHCKPGSNIIVTPTNKGAAIIADSDMDQVHLLLPHETYGDGNEIANDVIESADDSVTGILQMDKFSLITFDGFRTIDALALLSDLEL